MNLSTNAKVLLATACSSPGKQIINNSKNLDNNKYVSVNGQAMNGESFESYSLWVSALEELIANDLVKQSTNEIVFNVTHAGIMQDKVYQDNS